MSRRRRHSKSNPGDILMGAAVIGVVAGLVLGSTFLGIVAFGFVAWYGLAGKR